MKINENSTTFYGNILKEVRAILLTCARDRFTALRPLNNSALLLLWLWDLTRALLMHARRWMSVWKLCGIVHIFFCKRLQQDWISNKTLLWPKISLIAIYAIINWMNILSHEREENKNKNFDRSGTLSLKNAKLKFKKLYQEKWSQYRPIHANTKQ